MFQLGRINIKKLQEYIIIKSDDEIEEDDELWEFNVNEQEQENTEPGSQRQATSQVRILQGEQLRHLGEGRVYFWTKGTISGYFAEYKRGMANVNAVILEQHPEPRRREVTASTIWKCDYYTDREVSSIVKSSFL